MARVTTRAERHCEGGGGEGVVEAEEEKGSSASLCSLLVETSTRDSARGIYTNK